MLNKELESAYISILREELVDATGCTEPIAIAYAAARMRQILGVLPQKVFIEVSGNIIKNVKSVVVPNTGGLKGIQAAAAAGIVAGEADRQLLVISQIPENRQPEILQYLQIARMDVECMETTRLLDIRLTGWAEGHRALVHIANNHSNIVREERDDTVVLDKPFSDSPEDNLTDKSILNVVDILEFVPDEKEDRHNG